MRHFSYKKKLFSNVRVRTDCSVQLFYCYMCWWQHWLAQLARLQLGLVW